MAKYIPLIFAKETARTATDSLVQTQQKKEVCYKFKVDKMTITNVINCR